MEFLAGSEVGQVQCANVSISVDGLIEADESFSVHATVSPSSVRFVSGQSATADVIIRDDDGKCWLSDVITCMKDILNNHRMCDPS